MENRSGMGGDVATMRDPNRASLRANHAILKSRMTVEAANPHTYEQDGRAVTRVPLVMGRDGSFIVLGAHAPSDTPEWQAGHDTMVLGAATMLPHDQPLSHYWLHFHAPYVRDDGSVPQQASGWQDDKTTRLLDALHRIAGLQNGRDQYPEGQSPSDVARRAIEDWETPVIEASVLPADDIRERVESLPEKHDGTTTFRSEPLRPGLTGGVREADSTDTARPDPVQAEAFPQEAGTIREADPAHGATDVYGRQHDEKTQI